MAGSGSFCRKCALEEHMLLEVLRFRFGRGTPGAALRMTAFFGRLTRSDAARLATPPSSKNSAIRSGPQYVPCVLAGYFLRW